MNKRIPLTKKQNRLIAIAKKVFEDIDTRQHLYNREKDGTPIFRPYKVQFYDGESTDLHIPLVTLRSEELQKFPVPFKYWQVSAIENTLTLTIEFDESETLDDSILAGMNEYEQVCEKCGQKYIMTKSHFDHKDEPNYGNRDCRHCNAKNSIVIRRKDFDKPEKVTFSHVAPKT